MTTLYLVTPRAPAPPAEGRGRWASLHQRAGAARRPRPEAARGGAPEQYGGRAPHEQSIARDTHNVAHSGRAEGGFWSEGASGGAVHGPPLLPPPHPPGRPHPVHGAAPGPRPNVHAGGEWAYGERAGRVGNRGPPPRGGAGGPRRDPPPPPPPPRRPASRGGAGPHPPEAEGMTPLPPGGTAAPVRGRARTPHGPRPEKAGEHEPERYGGHALHDQSDASHTRFVACPGKAEGRDEAERPPAPLAPPAAQAAGAAHGPPPLPPLTPSRGTGTPRMRRPTLRGAPNPKPGRGEPGPGRPPPSTPDGARDGGRTRGGARTAWNGPTSAQRRDRARCARHTTQGGGKRTPREPERTHTHKRHAGTTRRAAGRSSRNAQTAWNGV